MYYCIIDWGNQSVKTCKVMSVYLYVVWKCFSLEFSNPNFTSQKWLKLFKKGNFRQNRVMLNSFRAINSNYNPNNHNHNNIYGGGAVGAGGSFSHKKRKTLSEVWRFLYKCRHRFRLPIMISVIAILINIPAFFEIELTRCWLYLAETDKILYSYKVSDVNPPSSINNLNPKSKKQSQINNFF